MSKPLYHKPVSNGFAAKRLLIFMTSGSVATSKLITWTDQMLAQTARSVWSIRLYSTRQLNHKFSTDCQANATATSLAMLVLIMAAQDVETSAATSFLRRSRMICLPFLLHSEVEYSEQYQILSYMPTYTFLWFELHFSKAWIQRWSQDMQTRTYDRASLKSSWPPPCRNHFPGHIHGRRRCMSCRVKGLHTKRCHARIAHFWQNT